jgi:DNA-binding NtrC family response regulator
MSETSPPKARLLIVDDEEVVRESLGGWFREEGYDVTTAESAKDALKAIQQQRWDACLTDIKMPGMDGIELQKRFHEIDPEMAVIVMTAYASVDTAVAALKAGAFDYITKPFDPEDLARLVSKAVDFKRLERENRRLKERIDESSPLDLIVGEDPAMVRLKEMIRTVGPTDSSVLIIGASGTGKELVARAVHESSPRRNRAFV